MFTLIALCSAMTWDAAISSEEETSTAAAAKHLADLFYVVGRDEIAPYLERSGLSPADTEEAVNRFMDGVGACTVAALVERNDKISTQFLSAMERGVSMDDFPNQVDDMSDAEFEAWSNELYVHMETCLFNVVQEAGFDDSQ